MNNKISFEQRSTFLDYSMTKRKQEIASRQKEEFELREFNGQNEDSNEHNTDNTADDNNYSNDNHHLTNIDKLNHNGNSYCICLQSFSKSP